MHTRCLATIVAESGDRFRLIEEQHTTRATTQRTTHLHGFDDQGMAWNRLETIETDAGAGHRDEGALATTVRRLLVDYGVEITEIIYRKYRGEPIDLDAIHRLAVPWDDLAVSVLDAPAQDLLCEDRPIDRVAPTADGHLTLTLGAAPDPAD